MKNLQATGRRALLLSHDASVSCHSNASDPSIASSTCPRMPHVLTAVLNCDPDHLADSNLLFKNRHREAGFPMLLENRLCSLHSLQPWGLVKSNAPAQNKVVQ